MSAARPDAPPAPKSGWKWFALLTLIGGTSAFVFGEVHETGSVALIVAAWAVLLAAVGVSFRRGIKHEQRRREASGI